MANLSTTLSFNKPNMFKYDGAILDLCNQYWNQYFFFSVTKTNILFSKKLRN